MIISNIIDTSQYPVKCPFSISPIGISIHNNGNLNSTAQNERDNLNWTQDERSFHYVTDKFGTIQCISNNLNSWANGDYSNGWLSKNYLNWEICEKDYTESEEMAINDIAQVLKSYGWGVDRIKCHSSFTPSSGCPRLTLPHWNNFITKVQTKLDILNNTSSKQLLYCVQVGAFKNKDNAIALSNKLKELGIENFIKSE